MPAIQVRHYRVYLMDTSNNSFAVILLYNDEGQYFARVRCMGTSASAPTQDSNGIYHLYYPAEDYEKVIDLLRNEKPIYFWEHGAIGASLSTGPEPVGDEEVSP